MSKNNVTKLLLAIVSTILLGEITGCTSFTHPTEEEIALADSLCNKGKTHKKQLQPDSAFICYKQAIEILKKSKEYEKLAHLYNKTGEILTQHGYYTDAIIEHQKAADAAIHLNDKSLLSKSYRRIGKAYGFFHKYDTTLFYLKKAMEISANLLCDEQADIYNNLAAVYQVISSRDSATNLLDSALYYNNKSLSMLTNEDARYADYLVRGMLFKQLNQYDSAKHYYKLVLHSDNIIHKTSSSKLLMNISKSLNETDSSHYAMLYTYWNDSLEHIKKNENIASSKENFKLKEIKKNKNKKYIYPAIISLIIILVVFLIFYKYKIKKLQEKTKEEIENHLSDIKEKQIENSKKSTELQQQKESLASEKEQIDNIIKELAIQTNKKGIEAAQKVATSPEFQRLRKKLARIAAGDTQEKFSKEDEQQLTSCIYNYFKEYFLNLHYLYNLTKGDCLICAIAKLNFTTKECTIYLDIRANAIRMKRTNAKKNLRKNTCGEKLIELTFENTDI